MGTLTQDDFRDEVRLVCGGLDANSPVWTDGRIDRRVNAAYLWVSMPNIFRHPELENTFYISLVADTPAYAYAITNHYMIYSVTHAEGPILLGDSPSALVRRNKLVPVDWREIAQGTKTAGKPGAYAYWNEEIIINCTPATAYVGQTLEVHGYRQPVPMGGPGETTLLKPEWDEIIVIGAEWRMWVAMNEHDRAYEAKQNLGAMVNEIADIRRLHGEEWGWQTADSGSSLTMRID